MKKLLRLPLTNSYNTRVSAVGALPTSAAVAGVAVAGVAVAGRGAQPTTKDAMFINCFKRTIADEAGGTSRRYLIKRGGFAASATVRSGHIGNAIRVWSGQGAGTKVITAFGNTDSSIYADGVRLTTNNGDTTIITGTATGITETLVSGTPTLAISSSDNTGWHYQDSGTVTKISDAQFPGNNGKTLAGTFAHLDGWTFILDTNGDLWNADLNTVSSWTANGYISAATYPDKGVAAIRWRHHIIVFGTQSMEFFRNAGNPGIGSPLVRVQGMAQKIGAISAQAIAEIADNIFFIGPAPEGGLSLFQFDSQLTRVSTPEQDALFLLMGNGNISVTTMRDVGLSFVLVTGGGLTYAYCVEEKFWFQMNGDNILWTKCAGLSVAEAQATYAVSSLVTSGKLFVINPLSRTHQDDSAAFTATAQLQTVDPGVGGFTSYSELELDGDVESGTSDVSVSWSDDDYATFSTARTLNMAAARPRTQAMGGTKNPRAYKLTHASNTPWRVREARLVVEIGGR